MDTKELTEVLITSFSDFSPREALLATKDSAFVQEKIKNKMGTEIYNQTLRATSKAWGEAWTAFERHYGAYTHGDVRRIIEGEEFVDKSIHELQDMFFGLTKNYFGANGFASRLDIIQGIERAREVLKNASQ